MPKNEQKTPEETKVLDESELLKFERSPDFRSIYANYVQTAHTAFDISLTFGETNGVPDTDGKALVEQKVRLSFSPLETLILRHMLNQVITLYQERFGPIAIPNSFSGLK